MVMASWSLALAVLLCLAVVPVMSQDCSGLSDCHASEVPSQGSCINDGECECFNGYTGDDCSTVGCGDVDGCNAPTGGTCIGPNTCSCNAGYQLPECTRSSNDDDEDPPPTTGDGKKPGESFVTENALAGVGVGVGALAVIAAGAYLYATPSDQPQQVPGKKEEEAEVQSDSE